MTAQPAVSAQPQTLWAVYDKPHQEIGAVFESRRDCETWCDEHNAWLGWDRYCAEPTGADEWSEDQVRWAER